MLKNIIIFKHVLFFNVLRFVRYKLIIILHAVRIRWKAVITRHSLNSNFVDGS